MEQCFSLVHGKFGQIEKYVIMGLFLYCVESSSNSSTTSLRFDSSPFCRSGLTRRPLDERRTSRHLPTTENYRADKFESRVLNA